MKVVATQVGQYNQVLRICDDQVEEVFELLKHPDGSDPVREDWVPARSADGKEIDGEGEYVIFKDKDGNTRHRDYAPDIGNTLIRRGPMRGEVIRSGWMKQVPDRVQCGLYPKGTDYWTKGVQLPQAWPRTFGPNDRRAAPMLDTTPKEAVG